MLEKLISLFSGSFAKIGLIGLAGVVLGIYASSLYYRAQIADFEAKSATLIASAKEEAARKLNAAIDSKNSALRRLDSAQSRIDDLSKRVLIAEASSGSANTGSGVDASASEGKCRKLLVEGGELLSEGSKLLGRCAADHDSLTEILK